jgi:hypothetical protein
MIKALVQLKDSESDASLIVRLLRNAGHFGNANRAEACRFLPKPYTPERLLAGILPAAGRTKGAM